MIKMIAILSFLAGAAMIYVVRRRRFYRRTLMWMEVFSSFEVAWITKLIERLCICLGTLLVLAGLIVFLISFY